MGKYLKLHERLLKEGLREKRTGYLGGLCNQKIGRKELEKDCNFDLFQPIAGEDGSEICYWGYDGKTNDDHLRSGVPSPIRTEYTPMRQTIVLLLAAMNNEL